jgi:hypothetical protein
MSANKVSWDFLPGEIVTQILIRLPIKSIITSICVSKTWKSIIQSPTFISTHLHHSTTNNNHHHHLFFRLSLQDEELYTMHNDNDDDDFTEHTRFHFPFHFDDLELLDALYRVVGTCNGLVCIFDDLTTYMNEIFLWNPCVRKFVKLPYPIVTYGIRWLCWIRIRSQNQ